MKLSGELGTALRCSMEQIIYEDKNIIVFHKPAGMLVQSDRSFDVDVVSSLMTYLAEKGEKPEIFVINRLDRPVSGLVLLAKNKKFAAALSQELQNGAINKEYYAVVCGSMPQKKGMLTDYLLKDARNNISEVVDSKIKGAKEAKLEYEVISSKNIPWNGGMQEVSLVKIHLITGRHHQIRVQFASRGVPLLGDARYNKQQENRGGWQNISLCSCKLEFLGQTFEIKPKGDGFEYFKEELETI